METDKYNKKQQKRLFDGEEDAEEIWQGMPEFKMNNLTAYKQLIVNFKTKEDMKRFGDLIKQRITETTKYIWFPKKDKEILLDYICTDES